MLDAIPPFPEMAPLDLTHKPAWDALVREWDIQASDFTFTNLYIWRHAYGAHLTCMDGVVCLVSWRADPEDSFILGPIGEGAGVEHVRACLDLLSREGHDPKIVRTTPEHLARLGVTADEFDIETDRNNWDYVYRVEDLIELDPARYEDKRRHVERFTKRFPFEYRRITPDLVPACQELQDLWCDEKHCDLHSSLRAEARAVKETLENLEALGVIGGAILVRDRVQAFSLGEPMSADTVVIHIEKASPDLHGAFQVINRQFLLNEWSDYEFVNREQDVGDPGLRKAKESYRPVRMVEKVVARGRS